MIMQVKDVGERGIFPFTIDSKEDYAYVCLGNHVGIRCRGFEGREGDPPSLAGKEKIPNRTHGVGLTPDETEIWISDQKDKSSSSLTRLKCRPLRRGHVELSQGGHGWVTFSLDGKYAWSHTPDVFDVKTKKLVATLKDETGTPISGSKFVEVHIRDGKLVWIGNEFGLGRKHAD